MGLETGTYVSDLVKTNPPSGDNVSQGDDHLRLIKTVLQNSFPTATKAWYFPTSLTKSADYPIVAGDQNCLLLGDTTGGNVILTLPTLAAGDKGWAITIQKIAAGNTLTVVGTINGETNFAFTALYQSVLVLWDGTNWHAIHGIRIIAGVPTLDTISVLGAATIAGILTLSSTSHLIPPSGTTAQRPSPAESQTRYNTDNHSLEFYNGTLWQVLGQQTIVQGFYRNKAIKVATNTTVAVTADAVIVSDGTSQQLLTGLSVTVDLGSSGAINKLDTGTIAIDQWYFIWALAKADGTKGCIASLQSTNNATFLSNLPTGYTQYALLGAVRTIHATATLYGTWQFGNVAHYKVGLAQTTAPPTIITGAVGTFSATTPTYAAESITGVVPTAIANIIDVVALNGINSSGPANVLVAPNTSYGSYGTATANPPPIFMNASLFELATARMVLESTNIAVVISATGGGVFCRGWEDNL